VGYQLGVDLGTTYTAAAIIRNGTAEVATLGTRSLEIPSVVFLRDDGELLIGEAAERRSLTEPDRFAREFKRRIGDPTPVLLAGAPFSAHTLMAKLLRAVVKVVSDREGGLPDHTVVTCPANWGDYKRELFDQALRQADVEPVSVVTEPEAAAVHYAATTRVGPGETVAVYDLGGGTFDAAILRNDGNTFHLVGDPQGIEQLGGVYFDDAVFSYVAGYVADALGALDPDDPGSVAAVSRLRRDCVEAKEALSWDTDTTIPVALPNQRTEIRLTRSEFEEMVRPALAESVEAMRRALRLAGVEPPQLKAVLLVGGSSRIPLVGQMLMHDLQRPIAIDVHPKHAVALGAAHIAAAEAAGSAAATAEPAAEARYGAFGPPVEPSGASRAVATVPAPPVGPDTAPTGPRPTPPTPPGGPDGRGAPDGSRSNRVLLVVLAVVAAVVLLPVLGIVLLRGGGGDGGGGTSSDTTAPDGGTSPTTAATAPPTLAVDLPTGPPLGLETMVFTSREGNLWNIAVVDQDGTGLRQITQERADKPRLPVLSPTRDTIAYTLQRGDTTSNWELWVTDTNGEVKLQLAAGLAADARATWSPDGTRLAYVSDQTGVPDLWVYDLTTGESTQLTQTDLTEADPAWSPDGERIAFSQQVAGNLDIYTLAVDDPAAEPVRLTEDPGGDGDPSWHPLDGSIAFARDLGAGNRDIFRMGGDGSGEVRVTDGPLAEEDPAWSPDGAYIAFESDRDKPVGDDDEYEIYVMLPDGTGITRVTTHNGFDAHPAWGLAPPG
jgi:Tol biopolymer transport system component/actin-like ATPase involved in cell morphogenesis